MATKKTVNKADAKAEKPVATKKTAAKKAASKSATKNAPLKQTKTVVKKTGKSAVGKAEKPESVKPAAPKKTGRLITPPIKSEQPAMRFKTPKFKVDENTGRPVLPKDYKPSADEEYMNPLQLEYFRQKLVARREELIEESKQTIENLRDEVRDIGDEAERASRETENALELRTRDRYRKLISKIDSVIRRVDDGDYGYCVDSGEEIGLERLEARPEAERTIDAQERWEIRRKQQGD